MTTIRPDVVSLLVDIDIDHDHFPHYLNHRNGEPFTDHETWLARHATTREIDAAKQYAATAQEYHASRLRDSQRLVELIERYAEGAPDSTPLSAVAARMTDAERTELEEILDQLAPDGYLHIKGESA